MFAKVVGKYLNKPFKRGGHHIKDGLDCYGFCFAVMREMGKTIPRKFGEWTLDNYYKLYISDVEEAERILFEAFDTIGEAVPPIKVIAGDLCIIRHQNGRHFPAIYIGNGNAMASFLDAGVRAFGLKNNPIVKARRV
jgi:cell wall-associated NlpC family hydrolase